MGNRSSTKCRITCQSTRTHNSSLRLRRSCWWSGHFYVKPQMKSIHLTSLVCFGIAMVCYLLTWVPGLLIFGVLGICFEIAAWVKLFSRKEEDLNDT